MGCFPGGERRGKRLVGGFYQLTKRVASNCTTHPRTVPATPSSRDVPGGGQLEQGHADARAAEQIAQHLGRRCHHGSGARVAEEPLEG